jgi:hypothetical protein
VSSINAQIDAAVEQMKAFEETLFASDAPHHALFAADNCNASAYHLTEEVDVTVARRCLVRAMVRCALALSLLPTTPEADRG